MSINTCVFCDHSWDDNLVGDRCMEFKGKVVCYSCTLDMLPAAYHSGGFLTHLIFTDLLKSNYNRKKRKVVSNYRTILKQLLHRYHFKCAFCSGANNLTIDHIKPVKLGGTDDISNLQILCKSCNSKKGYKYSNELHHVCQ